MLVPVWQELPVARFGDRPAQPPDHGGIFSGMISHPSPEEVINELGDKVVDAIVHAVGFAKDEFARYRREHPDWAAENAARTIADMIHDWMWSNVKQQLDSLPHVNLIDKDPRREIAVQVQSPDRLSYLLRLKLHHLDSRTSSYQTQTVIDFELQGTTQTFPNMGEVRLEAGYEWDSDTRTMGEPVLSLRHGRNNVIWACQLPYPIAPPEEGGVLVRPVKPGPTLPVVEVPERDADDETATEQT